jgi:hypothetical protein
MFVLLFLYYWLSRNTAFCYLFNSQLLGQGVNITLVISRTMASNPAEMVDTSWKGLYKWGGVSALLVGVIYLIAIVSALGLGVPSSSTGEGVLKWFSGQTTFAYTFYGLSIVTDVLAVPVVLALYLALKGVNKNAMLAATGFGGLFLALDLGVTLITWIALITLSQNYAVATSDVQRAAYLATADYAVGITSVSATVYGSLIFAIWPLITSLVMLKGVFSKATAYVGIVGSIVSFVYGITVFVPYSSSLAVILVIEFILIVIWLLLVGYRLYRLGKR